MEKLKIREIIAVIISCFGMPLILGIICFFGSNSQTLSRIFDKTFPASLLILYILGEYVVAHAAIKILQGIPAKRTIVVSLVAPVLFSIIFTNTGGRDGFVGVAGTLAVIMLVSHFIGYGFWMYMLSRNK